MDRVLRSILTRLEVLEAQVEDLTNPSSPELAAVTADMCPDDAKYLAKHIGAGRYAVIGPDGLRVTDFPMDKEAAQHMAYERNMANERNTARH